MDLDAREAEDSSAFKVNFFIFDIFSRIPLEQALIVLNNRQRGFFELKVKRFFAELQKVGIDDATCQRFLETTDINPEDLSDLSVLIFHALNASDELNKSQIIAWIFIDFINHEIFMDTAQRLVRAVQQMYYPDLIKLATLPPEQCLSDQLFIDSSLSTGILTALEKGRFSDTIEDEPLAFRLNYLAKELIAIIKNRAALAHEHSII